MAINNDIASLQGASDWYLQLMPIFWWVMYVSMYFAFGWVRRESDDWKFWILNIRNVMAMFDWQRQSQRSQWVLLVTINIRILFFDRWSLKAKILNKVKYKFKSKPKWIGSVVIYKGRKKGCELVLFSWDGIGMEFLFLEKDWFVIRCVTPKKRNRDWI